jgi:flagellar basal-body rod protein FlgG
LNISMSNGLSGLETHGKLVEVTGNNLANLNTSGFQSSRVAIGDNGASGSDQVEIGRGAQVLAASRNTAPGPIIPTGAELDLAIQGGGFFQVSGNGQALYTRDGSFQQDADRFVVDSQGNRLQPEIQLPPEAAAVRVDSWGNLEAIDSGGNVVATDTVKLYTFPNPAGLASVGGNDYIPTAVSGDAIEQTPGNGAAGTLGQGFLEGANVDPAREMVNLILGQRGFEANLKVIRTADEMLGLAVDIKV